MAWGRGLRPARLRARLASGLDAFFAPQPQQGMVIARIGLGLVLFGTYAMKLPALQEIYGPYGVGGYEVLALAPQLDAGRPLDSAWQHLHRVTSPELILALYGLLVASSLAFAAGLRTRLSGVLLLLLHGLFHARNPTVYAGWAVMVKPWLLYVILSPSGSWLSVDAWLRRRRGLAAPDSWLGPAAPVRLLQVHVCALYAMAGFRRLTSPEWLAGEVVFSILTDRFHGRFDVDWVPFLPGIRLVTWGVYVLEPAAAILLWVPRLRALTVLALFGLHVGMEALTNADWWQPMMLSVLWIFLPWSARGGLDWSRSRPWDRRRRGVSGP